MRESVQALAVDSVADVELRELMRNVFEFLRRHSAPAMFAAGFLFDFFTLQRIDAWLDLAFQLAYLAGLTALLVFQHREAEGRWVPGSVVGRVWR